MKKEEKATGKISYVVEVTLSQKTGMTAQIDVEVDKDASETYYDDVLDAAYEKIEEKYPEKDFPSVEITAVFAWNGDELCPCVSDDMKDVSESDNSDPDRKMLVLPSKRYSLTPECRLYLELQKNKVISEYEEFDFNKYHTILEGMKAQGFEG